MKRRTLLLGSGTLLTVSLGATATHATVQDAVSVADHTNFLDPISPSTLIADPNTELAESVHTWDVNFSNSDDEITSITVDYGFADGAGSFDRVSSDDVAVEFRQNGELTPVTIAADSYSGSTATFDITDTDTTAERRARVRIGTPDHGLENPPAGTYRPTLTFETASRTTDTYRAEYTVRDNDAEKITVGEPGADHLFTAVPAGSGNRFEIDTVDIRADDGTDLTEVSYEVREGTTDGTIIAEKRVSFNPQTSYDPSGTPAEIISPDDGYSISTDQLYTLTALGTDTDGNYDSATVQDTSGNQPSAISIQDPSDDSQFTADPVADEFVIAPVTVRDDDTDNDLTEVEYTVYEGDTNGTVVATETVTFRQTGWYTNDAVSVTPDDASYSVQNGQQYTLLFTARDVDENSDTSEVTDTA